MQSCPARTHTGRTPAHPRNTWTRLFLREARPRVVRVSPRVRVLVVRINQLFVPESSRRQPIRYYRVTR